MHTSKDARKLKNVCKFAAQTIIIILITRMMLSDKNMDKNHTIEILYQPSLEDVALNLPSYDLLLISCKCYNKYIIEQ